MVPYPYNRTRYVHVPYNLITNLGKLSVSICFTLKLLETWFSLSWFWGADCIYFWGYLFLGGTPTSGVTPSIIPLQLSQTNNFCKLHNFSFLFVQQFAAILLKQISWCRVGKNNKSCQLNSPSVKHV